MARVGEKNGTGTDGKSSLVDNAGSMWTLSAAAAVAGVRGFAVNKGGVDTAFPQNRCSQLFFIDGNVNLIYGKKIKGGWYSYNGSAWVPSLDPRNL